MASSLYSGGRVYVVGCGRRGAKMSLPNLHELGRFQCSQVDGIRQEATWLRRCEPWSMLLAEFEGSIALVRSERGGLGSPRLSAPDTYGLRRTVFGRGSEPPARRDSHCAKLQQVDRPRLRSLAIVDSASREAPELTTSAASGRDYRRHARIALCAARPDDRAQTSAHRSRVARSRQTPSVPSEFKLGGQADDGCAAVSLCDRRHRPPPCSRSTPGPARSSGVKHREEEGERAPTLRAPLGPRFAYWSNGSERESSKSPPRLSPLALRRQDRRRVITSSAPTGSVRPQDRHRSTSSDLTTGAEIGFQGGGVGRASSSHRAASAKARAKEHA